jgi:cell shape-determining protein MreC
MRGCGSLEIGAKYLTPQELMDSFREVLNHIKKTEEKEEHERKESQETEAISNRRS